MDTDIILREKKGYRLLVNNHEPEAVHLITQEWIGGGSDSNLVRIYREDIQKVIDALTNCLQTN